LAAEGYNALVVFNPDRNMYRVVAASYDDRMQAAQARDDFKARHPNNADFQKAWLLYRVY
jgi:cell division protein FtsN